jgi:hypothetical protein
VDTSTLAGAIEPSRATARMRAEIAAARSAAGNEVTPRTRRSTEPSSITGAVGVASSSSSTTCVAGCVAAAAPGTHASTAVSRARGAPLAFAPIGDRIFLIARK